MSVKRRDLVRCLEQNGFSLLREGGKHLSTQMELRRFRSNDIER
jgi:predicted RNA binding protein YcfA (HicA-like mRNA interferase family)